MSELMKQYAVVGNGKNKEGKPYSKCMKIVELQGGRGCYLSAKDVIYLYSGTTGSGKSYHAVADIHYRMKKRKESNLFKTVSTL